MFINDKPDSQRGNDIKAMEHPTLKVPYEVLNKKYRVSQKIIDREVNHLNQSIQELRRSTSLANAHKALDNVVENLTVVKRKADESMLDEQEAVQVCKRRLDHLKGAFTSPENKLAINIWKKKRLDRLLVDHLLREGFYESATRLSETSNLGDLTNVDLFQVSKRVEEALAAGDTSKCLAWCHDNRSKLRKVKSTLEFKIRQQEFIELVKQGKRFEAVEHARKYLTTNIDDSQRPELEHIMSLLAHPLDTKKEPFRSLLDPTRWQTLIDVFRQDNYNLYHLNSVSVFSVVLQAGLSALKTPHCYKKSGQPSNPDCPVCSPLLNDLAKKLPYPHSSQSKLTCSISGQTLNGDNPPLMLPNGYIYGEMSLRAMAAQNNGMIVCPKTEKEYRFSDTEKVYVM